MDNVLIVIFRQVRRAAAEARQRLRRPRLRRAREAASGKDIRIGGGASTVRQYLEAGLIDEMHVAIAPALLGAGEHLFGGLDLPKLGYRCSFSPGEDAAHFIVEKAG